MSLKPDPRMDRNEFFTCLTVIAFVILNSWPEDEEADPRRIVSAFNGALHSWAKSEMDLDNWLFANGVDGGYAEIVAVINGAREE